jgi:hypothetical protein
LSSVIAVLQVMKTASAIFKSAAWHALLDEEVVGFFSCNNASAAVVAAYKEGFIQISVHLWKFIMPKDARDVFQKEGFHPTSVSSMMQLQLWMSTSQLIFDMYIC